MAARAVAVGVLAALWVCLGPRARSSAAAAFCDTGKLFVDRDLPPAAATEDCGLLTWPDSTQHGAAVLLYHPCAEPGERHLLSGLAHSCLRDYIITSHPQLSRHRPIAVVSWGHTLELISAASLDVCDWLESTNGRRRESDRGIPTQKYDLLLTRPAASHQQRLNKTKGSLKQCCVQTISSLLEGAAEVNTKEVQSTQINARKRRSALESNPDTWGKASSFLTNPTQRMLRDSRGGSSSYGSSVDSLLTTSFPRRGHDSEDLTQTKASTPLPFMRSTPGANSLGLGGLRFQKSEPEAEKHARSDDDLRPADVAAGKHRSADSEQSANAAILKTVETAKQKAEEKKLSRPMKINKAFEGGERQRLSPTHSRHISGTDRVESASKSQSESPKQQDLQQVDHSRPHNLDCGVCEKDKPCACTSGGSKRPAAVNRGLPRTPRTDEAVWAAGALGFLLVLLTLSVLHTRLYRHWRTSASLYWHDPQRDYDTVADVIRRRLRNVKPRRKRGRRQECVLLPSSSSSDEEP
uniref:Tumor protein p53-inducible protein 13 n=1 Tax=Oryzias latipes TaxID=8090 RepID=A0A3B3I3I0_ORYLA